MSEQQQTYLAPGNTMPRNPGQSGGAAPGAPGGPPAPGTPASQFNRQAFIKAYATMVARTWIDASYLQLILTNAASTLASAGIATVPGAVIRIIEHKITGSGKIEDQVNAWIEGNRTGLYDLFLAMKPDDFNVSPGGAAGGDQCAGGDGPCCCCSPCCCCG